MSAERLVDDQASVDRLYFKRVSVFDGGKGVERMDSLCMRFANGAITAEQFVSELNRVAQMFLLEQ